MLSTPGVNLARENQKGACATTIFSYTFLYLPRATTIYRLGGAHAYSKGARVLLAMYSHVQETCFKVQDYLY